MSSAAHLLLMSSVALLARAQDSCSSSFIGEYGVQHVLPVLSLAPGPAAWDVLIPEPDGCGMKIGVSVTVCDPETSPDLDLSSLDRATVRRNGPRAVAARVYRTAHCRARARRPTAGGSGSSSGGGGGGRGRGWPSVVGRGWDSDGKCKCPPKRTA